MVLRWYHWLAAGTIAIIVHAMALATIGWSQDRPPVVSEREVVIAIGPGLQAATETRPAPQPSEYLDRAPGEAKVDADTPDLATLQQTNEEARQPATHTLTPLPSEGSTPTHTPEPATPLAAPVQASPMITSSSAEAETVSPKTVDVDIPAPSAPDTTTAALQPVTEVAEATRAAAFDTWSAVPLAIDPAQENVSIPEATLPPAAIHDSVAEVITNAPADRNQHSPTDKALAALTPTTVPEPAIGSRPPATTGQIVDALTLSPPSVDLELTPVTPITAPGVAAVRPRIDLAPGDRPPNEVPTQSAVDAIDEARPEQMHPHLGVVPDQQEAPAPAVDLIDEARPEQPQDSVVARAVTRQPPAIAKPDLRGVIADYAALLKSWLGRHMHYPVQARLNGIEGTAVVRVVMSRDGRILSYQLEQSSGHAVLDREAIEAVKRSAPLPPLPPEMKQIELKLRLPLVFSVRNYEAQRTVPPIYLQ